MQNVQIVEERCGDDLQVTGDRAKFRQALINLCKNSIEAIPNGGMLTIETKLHAGGQVICIRDTGIGMTKEQLSRLGTLFFFTKEKGTGLGTMVFFSILRTMRGDVETKSEPGKGTAFTISFANEEKRSRVR
ncbi:HAMP domain-containing sensor histidine kinase [Paenibacillus sp. LHD-38]|uniref:HAMP domain-containing sensor histidine kinase n=1 Tax=Paenibacillus sp. LHD-38 TaxID=3072143 RepID=UPI00280D9C00|nr:HAMP domain-containing sensor histidine kinase [Paenibacillus sp. LHD-38]MDQ8737987.1 HAMP domain-containing sensor histidine kinase [Paenibacillus sp. LHD-38]